MLTTTIAQAILVPTLLFPTLAPSTPQAAEKAPPSTVPLKKTRATVGAAYKEIKAMLEENAGYRINIRALDAETPEHKADVSTFHMMVTEVSNEQYAAFVKATGHRPPFEWGEEALAAAAQEFLKKDHERREKLKAEGKPTGERKKFDTAAKQKWWEENWRDADWAIPKGAELRPVAYVSYADAQAYAAWAGLRLPTEVEYQRAVRGNSDSLYPWGDEWVDGKYAATSEIKRLNTTMPVGSYPEGATKEGIFDLAGNVWEWTQSPYGPLNGFKKNKYQFGKGAKRETLEAEPDWNANQRVVVGGCFQNSKVVARATTRRATDRTQMTSALGFRCAASEKQGVDIAEAMLSREVMGSAARPGQVKYLPRESAAIDRWAIGSSGGSKAPAGYAVIESYDFIVFTPVEQIPQSGMVDLNRESQIEPQHIGFLTTNQELLEPALPAGTYLIAYRASGKVREAETEGEEGEEEPVPEQEEEVVDPALEGVDLKRDNYIFYDAATGEVATTVEVGPFKVDKIRGPSTLAWEDKKVWVGSGDDKVQEVQKWILLDGAVQSPIRNRGLRFELRLLPNKRAGGLDWR